MDQVLGPAILNLRYRPVIRWPGFDRPGHLLTHGSHRHGGMRAAQDDTAVRHATLQRSSNVGSRWHLGCRCSDAELPCRSPGYMVHDGVNVVLDPVEIEVLNGVTGILGNRGNLQDP